MKKQILLLFAMLVMAGSTFAQATAYPVPDLVQCNYEIFDLTVQDAPVLGNQDPGQYDVTYFTTLADAQNNSNPITNPTAFVPNNSSQTIYAQVMNGVNDDIDVTSFDVTVISVPIQNFPDVYACTSYTLPALPTGYEYYTARNGGGITIPAGTTINTSQTVYVYTSVPCPVDASFNVTLGILDLPEINDVQACGSYTLPALTTGNYFTGSNGSGTRLAAGTVLRITQTIYIYAQEQTCTAEESFTVVISPGMAIDPENVAVCGSYTLPAVNAGGYYTSPGGPNGGGELLPAGTVITVSRTLYLYFTSGNCIIEGEFIVTILTSDTIALTPISGCGNDTGMANFDLTQAIAQIQQTIPNAEVEFFTNAEDAATSTNAITNTFAYNAVASTVYAGVSIPNNCYYTLALNLVITNCTDAVLSGVVRYDANSDGCSDGDAGLSGIQVSFATGNITYNTYTNGFGEYAFYNIPPGSAGEVWLNTIDTNVYHVASGNYDVVIGGEPVTADFCVTAVAPFTNVAVYVWPSTNVVPGFTAGYFIDLYNFGTTTESGQVTFTFDSTLFTFLSSSEAGTVSGNTITFNYTNLLQGQQRYIYIEFTAAQPPVLNLDDEVAVSASITPLTDDMYPDDNAYTVTQIVANSYDPNDITVDKGEFITLEQADDYLQYTIRFQNMGTANATNVRIATVLDPNLDWETFQPVGASHTYRASRTGADVQFSFDGIQLPYESADEPGSHGSVSYRIKPKATLAIGDVMAAQAGIYFDFNEAIITNIATTTVRAIAGLNTVKGNGLKIYPNPATGIINLQLNNAVDAAVITITDVLGKTVLTDTVNGTQAALNIASLKSGVYFVTLKAGGKQLTNKLIVK